MGMKLVIGTQHCENYGAHAWNGEGECPQRWKFKGGDTYVVDNITPAQQAKIEAEGIPTLSKLIENSSEAWREYVLSYSVVADDAPEGEKWETPFRLSYEDGKWVARRETRYDNEYNFSRKGLKAKNEQYDILPEGGRANYSCMYTLDDGRVLDNDAACKALAGVTVHVGHPDF
jgi:hypothetical protein